MFGGVLRGILEDYPNSTRILLT